jgi:hypothetical protein
MHRVWSITLAHCIGADGSIIEFFVPFGGPVCALLWLLLLIDRPAFFLPQLVTTEECCDVFVTL